MGNTNMSNKDATENIADDQHLSVGSAEDEEVVMVTNDEEASTLEYAAETETEVITNDEEATTSEYAAAATETKDYEILSQTELVAELNKLANDTSEVLRFDTSICKALLHHYKWNKDMLTERFYDTPDTDAFFQNANLLDPTKHSKVRGAVGDCPICDERNPLTGLLCNHLFCNQCWSEYLSCKVLNEGRPFITCPQQQCTILADDAFVLGTIKKENTLQVYNKLMLNSFVQANTLIKWCPAAECGCAIKVPHAEPRKIVCKCKLLLCFGCTQQWHEPISCDMLKMWMKKCADDSETSRIKKWMKKCADDSETSNLIKKWMKKCADDNETSNWISANTKDCPKCSVAVEKNGGCNQMTCRIPTCRYQFCWVCLGSWATHLAFGDAWSCNRFVDADVTKQIHDPKTSLKRYLHYYMRYTNHQNSLKLERKLILQVCEKTRQMQELGFSWIETQFLRKAVEVLEESRRTLMYTYVFAFYLQKNNITGIFEANQSDLELATEQLSGYLERELPDEKQVAEVKQKVQDKYRYVEQHRQILLKHFLEGQERKQWVFQNQQ